jgi:hypothetical protein
VPLSIKARRQQGLSEICRLTGDFEEWEKYIALPQYATQVESLSTEVLDCAKRLKNGLENLTGAGVGAAYGECAKIEKQIAWLWRAWDYFRTKFDQRSNPRYGETLHAADEVVWSCYRPFFGQPFDRRVPEPAPLPYIEMEYSPVAVRRDQGGVISGKPAHQELLAAAFQKLPLPVLKLPVSAIENPWLIALAAHETGHFLQRMISPDPLEFVTRFRTAVETGANQGWGPWSIEIFADWYSVLMLGQWSLHPIAQFATGSMADNVKPGGVYPPLLVRLHLMAELADFYEFPGSQTLRDLGLDEPKTGDFQDYDDVREAVSKVVRAIVELDECRQIVERIDRRPDNFLPGGLVDQWSAHIANGAAQPEVGRPDSARLVAAGSVQVWDRCVFTPPDPPSDDLLEIFRVKTRDAINGAAMPGVRSSSAETTPANQSPGDVLFDFLETVARE